MVFKKAHVETSNKNGLDFFLLWLTPSIWKKHAECLLLEYHIYYYSNCIIYLLSYYVNTPQKITS